MKNIDSASVGLGPQKSSTYHVTAWDGINDSNKKHLHKKYKYEASMMLESLSPFVYAKNNFFESISKSLLYNANHVIEFNFDELVINRNMVLVATLKPHNDCEKSFDNFIMQRKILNNQFLRKFGHHCYNNFTPHITLGNFVDSTHGHKAKKHLTKWNDIIKNYIVDRSITFDKTLIFGFTSMDNFFNLSARAKLQKKINRSR